MKTFSVDLESLQTVVAAVLDATGVLISANAGFLRLLPPDCTQPIGTRLARCFIQPGFPALLAAIDESEADGYRGLMTIGDYNGVTRTLRGRAWRSGSDIRVLAEYDIVDLERLTDAMLDLNRDSLLAQRSLAEANAALKQNVDRVVETSLTDALTGVGNRRKLQQVLRHEIDEAHRSGAALSVIMVDLDLFKLVNDRYGHAAGDKVLAHLGALLKSQTRSGDSVIRFGGEEFLVLMPHAPLAQALSRAEQIRCALASHLIEPLRTAVTASFGVAELARAEDGETLLGRADAALYRAKQGGRNRVVAADSDSRGLRPA
jgi:diguanylate cyclase (GGDEF)-like protein